MTTTCRRLTLVRRVNGLANADVHPLRFLGTLLVWDDGALDGLTATCRRELGKLRRRAVAANRDGDSAKVCATVERMRKLIGQDPEHALKVAKVEARRLEARRREDRRALKKRTKAGESGKAKAKEKPCKTVEVRDGTLTIHVEEPSARVRAMARLALGPATV